MRQFSYIIPYRADDQQVRAANLQAVLRWLSQMPDVEVILVEQDKAPTLTPSTLPANCQHVFAPNAGPFNKSWAFNVGFRHSTGKAVAFGDADLIVAQAALRHCFENCLNGLDAVKPYDRLIDLTREESEQFLSVGEELTVQRDPQQANREGIGEFVCFCGGLFMMRRGVYEKLGGFDERFIGWGGEDDAMTIKLRRLVTSARVLTQSPAFHLWHERSQISRYGHPHYQQNLTLLREYTTCDLAALQALCAADGQAMGDIRKYAPV